MEIKKVPISQIGVWDKNPRNIKTKDFERLKRQIQELGVYKPLICFKENGKYITLGGNMRLRALEALNQQEIDISIVNADTEALKIKYALSDNDRAGEYDEQKLAELVYPYIDEISLEDFKVDLGEADTLQSVIEEFAPNLDGTEDEVPEIDDSPAMTKTGDLFQLGRHRLLCGDATKKEDVERLMNGEKVDMVFTDPPYGIEYKHDERPCERPHKFDSIRGDGNTDALEFSLQALKHSVSDSCVFYIWHAIMLAPSVYQAIKKSGGHISEILIWAKPHFAYSRYHYHWQHEPCVYGWYGKQPGFYGERNQSTLWLVDYDGKKSAGNDTVHPNQKPTKLALIAIKNSTKFDKRIVDPFLGSGTTLIACEKLNRICCGMEIEPKYCDVIITRYSKFTDIPEEEIRATRQNG